MTKPVPTETDLLASELANSDPTQMVGYNDSRYRWDPTTHSFVLNESNVGASTGAPKPGDLSPDGSMIWDGYNWGWNSPDPNLAFDPSLGTDVRYGLSGPTGLDAPVEHFDPGQNPELFLSAGENYADTGGMKAAVPGTDLYNQLQADNDTRDLQGILKVAALVGSGALAANSAWSLGAEGAGGAAEGAGALTGVDTGGAAFLPEVAGSGIPYFGAAEGAGAFAGAAPALEAFPALAEGAGGAGGASLASGEYSGLTPAGAAPPEAAMASGEYTGLPASVGGASQASGEYSGLTDAGAAPAEAAQASGEYAASSGGLLSKLKDALKDVPGLSDLLGGDSGGGSAQPQRQLQMPFVNRMPAAPTFLQINRPKRSRQALLVDELANGDQ